MPIPLRLTKTESALLNRLVGDSLIEAYRKTLAEEIQPINDIRSTAAYRTTVLVNLLGEFLQQLMDGGVRP